MVLATRRGVLVGVIALVLGVSAWIAWRGAPESPPNRVRTAEPRATRGHPNRVLTPHGLGSDGVSEDPNVVDRETFFPRPPSEWQGMRVRSDLRPLCVREDGCGLALACLDGRCGPCRSDFDCAPGEVCALDHCLRGELTECTTSADCPEGAECVLSGYSRGIRGNETMRSFCLSEEGPTPESVRRIRSVRAEGTPAPPPPVSTDALFEDLATHRKGAE